MGKQQTQDLAFRRTRLAVLGSQVLNEPLMTVYTFVPFLLYRDLQATQWMVTVLMMLKPFVSIFSLYWSQMAYGKPKLLLGNVLGASIIGRIPFLFFPWIDDPWTIIGCAAFFMLTYRASIPAWMEILKLNLGDQRGRIFSLGSAVGYGEGILLAIGIGAFLDQDVGSWRWIFPLSSVIGILGLWFQARVPVCLEKASVTMQKPVPDSLITPWTEAFRLMRERPDFRRFQWGIMVCASGLMIIQPALPIYFVDYLGITYTELAIALSVCKGLGYCSTSAWWGRSFHKASIFNFSAAACFSVGIFPFLLFFAQYSVAFLYLAYFAYGIGQAGCHLNWNMSGTAFAKGECSSVFTGVNVLTVGIRGLIVPPLGGLLCAMVGPFYPIAASLLLCFGSAMYMRERPQPVLQS